jgi:hypothetical protein
MSQLDQARFACGVVACRSKVPDPGFCDEHVEAGTITDHLRYCPPVHGGSRGSCAWSVGGRHAGTAGRRMTRYPYDPEERLDLMRDVWEEHGLKTRHRMGGGFYGQCPHPDHTHGDRKLSLTVHIGKFGTIMMFCGLDHQPEEIFDLVDLHPGILRGRRHKGQTSQNAAERGKKGGPTTERRFRRSLRVSV